MNPILCISALALSKPGAVGYTYGVALVSVGIPDDDVVTKNLQMNDIQIDEISITVPSRTGQHCCIKFRPDAMKQGTRMPNLQGFQGTAPK